MVTHIAPPADPIAAVSHPDPWAYYDGLVARGACRDDSLGAWVVAAAGDVAAILHHPLALVRPAGEPVPAHLVGTPAGDLFGRLVRMRDDERHPSIRAAIDSAVGVGVGDFDDVCRSVTGELQERLPAVIDGAAIDRWMRDVPAAVLARWCGIDALSLDELVCAASALAACFAPGARSDVTAAASRAAEVLQAAAARPAADLLAPAAAGDAVANIAGLFFQAFDATAGLIGTTIVHMSSAGRGAPVADVVQHVLGAQPPVHNTRRFMAADAVVAGLPLRRGDTVVVVLAAERAHRSEFGGGRHACPAHRMVPTIATHAVRALVDAAGAELPRATGYCPSRNVRIPRFDPGAGAVEVSRGRC